MTMSTLIMVGVGLLVAVGSILDVCAAGLLIWTARRFGGVEKVRNDVALLDTKISGVAALVDDHYEQFDSYRKRDAQRVSAAAQRAKKANGSAPDETQEETPAPPAPQVADAVAALFQ